MVVNSGSGGCAASSGASQAPRARPMGRSDRAAQPAVTPPAGAAKARPSRAPRIDPSHPSDRSLSSLSRRIHSVRGCRAGSRSRRTGLHRSRRIRHHKRAGSGPRCRTRSRGGSPHRARRRRPRARRSRRRRRCTPRAPRRRRPSPRRASRRRAGPRRAVRRRAGRGPSDIRAPGQAGPPSPRDAVRRGGARGRARRLADHGVARPPPRSAEEHRPTCVSADALAKAAASTRMRRRHASCGCEFGLGRVRGELGSEPSAAGEADWPL